MLPRYLIIDVDDTLTVKGHLHPDTLEALERAAAAGIDVVLDTGRAAGYGAALLTYLRGVSAVVVENGGAWLDRHSRPTSGWGRSDESAGNAAELPVQLVTPPAPDLRPRLAALHKRVARRLGLTLVPAADNAFRLTDYTVLRRLPDGDEGVQVLTAMHEITQQESQGQGRILASSIHIHFMLDGDSPRSKADGVVALLRGRGISDPAAELLRGAVTVGDSANDASLFTLGRFALTVGVRNIERYLPELGAARPRHLTRAAEGLGVCELIEDLLLGKLNL